MFLRKYFKKENLTNKNNNCAKIITHQTPCIINIMSSFLEAQDLKNMTKVCKSSSLFSKAFKVRILLEAVVHGDLKKAEFIIIQNPQILLERGTVKDYSGRIHLDRTAFQLALGACDFNMKNKKGEIIVDGMAEMIVKHFNKLPGKSPEEINSIMLSQYKGQFPRGFHMIETQKIDADSKAINRIYKTLADIENEKEVITISSLENKIHTILCKSTSKCAIELEKIIRCMLKATSDEFFENKFQQFTSYLIDHRIIDNNFVNFNLLKELYQFRCHLEPKLHQTSGKHFNFYHLLEEALYLHKDVDLPHKPATWKTPKALFFWQKIIGGIESHLPACDAANLAQGLYYLFNKDLKSLRSQDFHDYGGKFYPLNFDSKRIIGHNCAVSYTGGAKMEFGSTWNNSLYDYLQQKTSGADIIQSFERQLETNDYLMHP